MRRVFMLCLLSGVTVCNCGFSCGDAPLPASHFIIQTTDVLGPVPMPGAPPPSGVDVLRIPRPYTEVLGNMNAGSQSANSIGRYAGYGDATNGIGLYSVDNPIVPASWNHIVYLGISSANLGEPCLYPITVPGFSGSVINLGGGNYESFNNQMNDNQTFEWQCYYIPRTSPGIMHFATQNSLPATITLSSNSTTLSSSNGYPTLYVYGKDLANNQILNTVTASSVSPDGTSATFPFPAQANGNPLPPSLYSAALVNSNPDGTMSPAGPAVLSIGASQTFITPFGVGPQVIQYSWYENDGEDGYGDGTCVGSTSSYSGSSTDAYPVVTQYSQNNVNVGGNLVAVGANPTSILLYNPVTDSQNNQNGPCSSSGNSISYMGNAVVANSGASTISVLDLASAAVIATLNVGMHPIGLALSADNSKVYVANSGDNTISSVNLNTLTILGNSLLTFRPATLDVANDGTIWIGGQGDVAHLSSGLQPLGVYSTNGYTISSLKFNSTGSELIALSTDSSGNVFRQEIDTTSTINNASYTILAQQQTATLPRTGTLAHWSSTTQNSAMPIQVANGGAVGVEYNNDWLALSATPNGFSILDTVGHISLMDVETLGPVTSVAVDQSQYVAYLAVPDSNTVVTVYLPQ